VSRLLRQGMKIVHEVASIGYGGALAACVVINQVADRGSLPAFAAARAVYAAIAQWVLLPSMAVVVVSGLISLAATRAYHDAGWAWMKAALGISVFQASLVVVGSASRRGEVLEAATSGDAATLERLLRAETTTLWVLLVLSVVNVWLAVWRPKFTRRVSTG
jgi:hypothetical protein